MKTFCGLIILLVFLISCSKEKSVERNGVEPTATSLNLLQHKWTLDSIDIFGSTDFSVKPAIGEKVNGGQYYDFRTDGKLYGFAGSPTPGYDTLPYMLLPDNVTLKVFDPNAFPGTSDTAHIIKLTVKDLHFYTRNTLTGDVGRFMLSR